MNLDKTLKELSNRLDEVSPASTTIDYKNRDDGINYWKGKKIIPTKAWNDLYEKSSSTYTNAYTTILTSRKPLQYFPDEYNNSISISNIVDEKLKKEIQKWNTDYYELLEYKKNPTLGRMKCSKCLLSGSNDDPIFVGIEKVFARIVNNQCNDNNAANNYSDGIITYHCNIMNIYSCPFESKESYDENEGKTKYPYKREDLFTLHQISFAIEQAITTFFEITKQNEIIFEVDFENDRVKEIHTSYYGEPKSWGWQENVNEQLSKVKPISNIAIRDEQDIYNILTNREKLETLIEEYESYHQLEEQDICCDEKSPCVNNNSDNEKLLTSTNLLVGSTQYQHNIDYSHKGENCHSKKSKIQEEFQKSKREQLILLKENKQNIIDFLLGNKESIRIEDLRIYEPIYKCYRRRGNCQICNILSNILCKNCNQNSWLCINHWQQHAIENH
jgi:hypothetical protein